MIVANKSIFVVGHKGFVEYYQCLHNFLVNCSVLVRIHFHNHDHNVIIFNVKFPMYPKFF